MATVSNADPYLLTTLVCPISGGILELSADGSELVSPSARLAFPVRDGIPILVVSEARSLTAEEVDGLKNRGKRNR